MTLETLVDDPIPFSAHMKLVNSALFSDPSMNQSGITDDHGAGPSEEESGIPKISQSVMRKVNAAVL